MSSGLAQRLMDVSPSASMSAMADVARLRREGRDILSLTVGEPDFEAPGHVVEAAIKALRAGKTRYTPTNGIPPLREAIFEKFNQASISLEGADITVGTGAKQLIFAALIATVNAGDDVIIPAPFWVSYPDMVRLVEGTPVIITSTAEEEFKLTPSKLRSSLTLQTRWVILNSPNNPSGAVYSPDEMAALGKILEEHDCLILSDEIYENFVYDGRKSVPFVVACPKLADRVLTANGVSKAYAMTGFRLGYAAGPAWLISAMNTVITQDTSCASSIAQVAAQAALSGGQSEIVAHCGEYQARRDMFVGQINEIQGIYCALPGGAFYAFASVEALIGMSTSEGVILNDDVAVAAYFLHDAGVATIAGSAFGSPGHIRFSFATSLETLEEAGRRLRTAVEKLQGAG